MASCAKLFFRQAETLTLQIVTILFFARNEIIGVFTNIIAKDLSDCLRFVFNKNFAQSLTDECGTQTQVCAYA
jgi:hypothetical protein